MGSYVFSKRAVEDLNDICEFLGQSNVYIIFYYPRQDGIDIVRIAYGKRDLKALFEEFRDEL